MVRDEYVAGMWNTGLVSQLAWSVLSADEESGSSRQRSYTAPSWSWAFINGCVHYANVGDEYVQLDHFHQIASILDVQTYTKSGMFGQVTGGFIKIRGPLSVVLI